MKPLVCVAAFLAVVASARGEYAPVEVEKVPVARLVENLEKQVKDNPKAAEPLLNLARAHAMAYAKKAGELEATKKGGVPWFGYEPPLLPFSKVEKTDDKGEEAKAQAHLASAIKRYAQAVALDPKDLTARLGQAWVTSESGKKDDAVKLYRKLIEDAWAVEKDLKGLGLSGRAVTAEAGGYLIALLDAQKDKDEIAALKEKVETLKKLPRKITPIAVPLKDGLTASDLEDLKAAVAFDADGSGLKKKWSWITTDAAWLVFDPKASGKIDSGLQLFGSVTFWMFWSDGYSALRALDDNRDGQLTGDELKGLALWHDANGNGVSDPGEVKPLGDYGVVSVSCKSDVLTGHPDRIQHSSAGVTFKGGKTRPTFDLILKAK